MGPIALIDNEEYELEYFARRFGLNAQDVRELIERRRSDPEAAMPAFLQKTRW
ncbi:DUF3606 domain-containing protein [Mesorhizobium sp. M7A.F.Ca.US.011.01.1.1]|nr:DUF3606 domain-containing protein [Mesorhizobium sp. M7A.F.Ca.US.011.01.1.1]